MMEGVERNEIVEGPSIYIFDRSRILDPKRSRKGCKRAFLVYNQVRWPEGWSMFPPRVRALPTKS